MQIDQQPIRYELPNPTAGYMPEVFAVLKSLDEKHLHHHAHELSHPADVFLLTFRDAMDCVRHLARSANTASQTVAQDQALTSEQLADIRHQVFELLFYTGNYIEACLSIIKSLFPKEDKRMGKCARAFKKSVEDYSDHVSILINKIKHQHRRPRIFTFTFGQEVIVGYYLEGMVVPGVLGPDKKLHPEYQKTRTGLSLNRAIPYHLCNIYYVAACLEAILKKHGKTTSTPASTSNMPTVLATLTEASSMKCQILPDEFDKPLPCVTHKENDRFILAYPGDKPVLNRQRHEARVAVEVVIGVYDRGIAPPYMMRTA